MIIALSGLPRVGKSTVANYLCKEYDFIQYSFADPIRKGLSEFFGWPLEDFDLDSKEDIDPFWGVSKRQMMEYIGTEILRKDIRMKFLLFEEAIGEHIWVKRFQIFYEKNKDKNIVVSDMRHNIEYNYLKDKATLIKIERPNYKDLNTSKCYDINDMEFNYIISNDCEGSIENLLHNTDFLLRGLNFED